MIRLNEEVLCLNFDNHQFPKKMDIDRVSVADYLVRTEYLYYRCSLCGAKVALSILIHMEKS